MEKIEDGTYGICDITSDEIPLPRLEAIPYATMTVKAQDKFEKGLLRFMKFILRRSLYLFFCSLVFLLDRILKTYIKGHITPASALDFFYPYGGIGVFQDWCGGIDFSINHVTNAGAAWGVLSSFDPALLVLRIVLIVGIAIHLFAFNKAKEKSCLSH